MTARNCSDAGGVSKTTASSAEEDPPLTASNLARMAVSLASGLFDGLGGALGVLLMDGEARELVFGGTSENKSRKGGALAKRTVDKSGSPSPTLAKKRARERRERGAAGGGAGARGRDGDDGGNLKGHVAKVVLINSVAWLAMKPLFEDLVVPGLSWADGAVRGVFLPDSSSSSDAAGVAWWLPGLGWLYAAAVQAPLFSLAKVLNVKYFQDVADCSFAATGEAPAFAPLPSLSVMVSDVAVSLLAEALFLVQATLAGHLPVPYVGRALGAAHLALLFSLYSFEYRWFGRGVGLHRRVAAVEADWPYFLGFGLPLAAAVQSAPGYVSSACAFSVLFPFYIAAAGRADFRPSSGYVVPLPWFRPALGASNALASSAAAALLPAGGGRPRRPGPAAGSPSSRGSRVRFSTGTI